MQQSGLQGAALPYPVLCDHRVFSSQTSHKKPYLHYFDGSHSSTYQPTTIPWSIRYGKGEVAGVLSRDAVRLGRYSADGYVFAEAVEYSADLVDEKLPLDGIVGMSFSELSRAKQPTLIDALHQQGQLQHRIFSFYLVRRGCESSATTHSIEFVSALT